MCVQVSLSLIINCKATAREFQQWGARDPQLQKRLKRFVGSSCAIQAHQSLSCFILLGEKAIFLQDVSTEKGPLASPDLQAFLQRASFDSLDVCQLAR